MKKTGLFIILSLVFSSMLSAQSLADLAKQEKERRAKVAKQESVLINNQNIAKFKKTEAVTIELGPASQSQLEEGNRPDITTPTVTEEIRPEVKTPPQAETQADFDQKLAKAQEYVELLTIKMNGLWQEFYSMDDMTSRDSIQRQIDTTYRQLEKAQKDLEALQKQAETRK